MTPEGRIRVAVFGAAGYAGALAARLIDRHPCFTLGPLTARSDVARPRDPVSPRPGGAPELEALDLDRHADVEAAIVAYPHGAAAELVAALRERGVRVIDLSADFRLRDPAVYEQWYRAHPAPEWLDDAVYGLPELYRDQIAGADLVANPGCFPTAAILGLAPLARAGLIADVVIDAKTGVSGAGRGASDATHFVTVDENMSAYSVPRHRHTPEIEQELAVLGAPAPITFTAHLIPLDQGELLTCYVTPVDKGDPGESNSIESLYEDAYGEEPFVEVVTRPPGVKDVAATNLCRISVHADPRTGRLLVFAAIDNLWKGTASQAVQNLNLMFARPETEGIEP